MNEGLSIGNIIRIILMQTKVIALIIFAFISLSLLNYFTTEKTYNIQSVLQVESTRSFGNEDISSFLIAGDSDSSNVQNQMFLYKKRSNLEKLIKDLSLHIYFQNVEDKGSIDFKRFLFKVEPEIGKELVIEFDENGDFRLIENDIAITPLLTTSKSYSSELIEIELASNIKNRSIPIIYQPIENAIFSYNMFIQLRSINSNVGFNMNNGGLISVNYVTSDTEKGKKILDTLNKIYVNEIVIDKSEKARKAINFIDEQLLSLQNVLENNKLILRDFLESNTSIDVDLETQALLATITEVQNKIAQLELEEAEIQGSYTETNPLYLNLISRRAILEEQLELLESKVRNLPTAQQKFISLSREVEISQTLYSELLNRKLNYSIAEASTLGNIKVIDEAYVANKVAPTRASLFLINIIGVILAVVTGLIRGIYFTPITNPAEIADKNISHQPLLGIFPFVDETQSKENDNSLNQSFESFIVNMKNINEGAKLISITSPTPSNGKSFTCFNLTKRLAYLGYKVLLIDADQKRGALHKNFNIIKTNLKDFNELESNPEKIEKFKIEQNVYVIPRISKIIDSFQLFDSGKFNRTITAFKDKFDYIIIDTAPFLSVSDTSVIMGSSDLNFLVVRHELSKPGEIKQAMENIEQLGKKFDGLIYNAFKRPSGYYGLYQYYGNYQYKYYADKYLYNSYGYDDEK